MKDSSVAALLSVGSFHFIGGFEWEQDTLRKVTVHFLYNICHGSGVLEEGGASLKKSLMKMFILSERKGSNQYASF